MLTSQRGLDSDAPGGKNPQQSPSRSKLPRLNRRDGAQNFFGHVGGSCVRHKTRKKQRLLHVSDAFFCLSTRSVLVWTCIDVVLPAACFRLNEMPHDRRLV